MNHRLQDVMDKMARATKSDEESIEDMRERYEDSIDQIDEVIDQLRKYKRCPEIMYNDHDYTLSVYSLNKRVGKLPKSVKTVYNEFRSEYPLLTGEEDEHIFNYEHRETKHKKRIKKNSKKHISFLHDIKNIFERAIEKISRTRYTNKASKQRGDGSVKPDMTPEKVRSELLSYLDEETSNKSDESNEGNKNDEDDEMRIMTRREFIHFVTEHIKDLSDVEDKSEQYKFIKDAHPKQTEVIRKNIHGLNGLRRIDYTKDGLFKLSEVEIEYIKYQINNEKSVTLEYFKENIYEQ